MEILVTSGGTRVPVDRVRHIANMSRGTFGSKLATSLLCENPSAELTFLRAVGSCSPLSVNIDIHSNDSIECALKRLSDVVSLQSSVKGRYSEVSYKSFSDYAHSLEDICKNQRPDIVFLAAAVSDYGTKPLKGKVRSKSAEMSIPLKKLPKLIGRVRRWCPNAYLVGFKLLVDSTEKELIDAARDSIKKNGCDIVVANDLRDIQNDNHSVTLVLKDGGEFRQTAYGAMNYFEGPCTLAEWVVRVIMQDYKQKQ